MLSISYGLQKFRQNLVRSETRSRRKAVQRVPGTSFRVLAVTIPEVFYWKTLLTFR